MSTSRKLVARLRGLFAGPHADRELSEEIELHVQLAAEDFERRGLPPAEARRAALLAFGGVARAQEEYRAQRGLPTVAALWQDARWSARSLAHNVLFTATVLLTLTIGVGATTAMFHVVDRAILHPLAYPDPQQLVYLGWTWKDGDGAQSLSARKFVFWHDNARVFLGLATSSKFSGAIDADSSSGDAAPLSGSRVTADFFRVLGMSPALGRAFAADEYGLTSAPVVILSHAAWEQRFARDPRIIGRTVRVNGASKTVIGVMPRDFDLAGTGEHADLLVPLVFSPTDLANGGNNYNVLARVKPGISTTAVRSDMQRVFEEYRQTYPEAVVADDRGVDLLSYAKLFVGSYQRIVWILFAATLLLFVLACANAGNLLLVRALGQRAQFAVCLALGAHRLRVMSRVVMEAAMLGAVGAGLAVLTSLAALHGLLAIATSNFVIDQRRIGLDMRVAVWMLVTTVGAMIVIGGAVAFSATRLDLASGLAEASRGRSVSRPQQRVAGWLVGLQTALTSVLLVGAALLIGSFAKVLRVNPGFERDGVVTATVAHVPAGYDSAAAVKQFTQRVLDAVQRDPSIAAGAVASSLPLQRGWNLSMTLTERPYVAEGAAEWRAITPGFFQVYGIPILRGRGLSEADQAGSEPVVVVSQSFAATYWPNGDALGQRITIGRFHSRLIGPKFADAPRSVVGIVPDLRDMSLEQRRPRHTMWIPWAQVPPGMAGGKLPSFAVRARDVHAATQGVHAALAQADSRVRNAEIVTMNTVVLKSLTARRFNMVLIVAFAAIALLLTCVGVYGVVAYRVSRRTSEIGIRMALGASPRRVTAMVVRQGMRPVVIGLAVGIAASFGVRGYLASLAYEIQPNDPVILGTAGLVIALVALMANYLPARRAARTNPVAALRPE